VYRSDLACDDGKQEKGCAMKPSSRSAGVDDNWLMRDDDYDGGGGGVAFSLIHSLKIYHIKGSRHLGGRHHCRTRKGNETSTFIIPSTMIFIVIIILLLSLCRPSSMTPASRSWPFR